MYGGCVFSLLISLVMNMRLCVHYLIIIIKSEVLIISTVRSWNSGMHCMSCYVLLDGMTFDWKMVTVLARLSSVNMPTSPCDLYPPWCIVDSFTVPLHSPNGRHLPAVMAMQRDCHWGLKNGGNSHWSREPTMQWGTKQPQSIFKSTNHKNAMPCLIPHWQSYCH